MVYYFLYPKVHVPGDLENKVTYIYIAMRNAKQSMFAYSHEIINIPQRNKEILQENKYICTIVTIVIEVVPDT